MSEPERRDHPTGLARRRARRIAPLVAEWVPEGVELWPEPAESAEGTAATVEDATIGPQRAVERPESDETPSGRVVTPEADQGERRRRHSARPTMPPGGWPMVPLDAEPVRAEPEACAAARNEASLPTPEPEGEHRAEPSARTNEPEPEGEHGSNAFEPTTEPKRASGHRWHSADDPELAALLAWVPPEVDHPAARPFGAVVLPAVVPGAPRPAAHLAFMGEVGRACRQSAHVIIDTGGDAAEALTDDVRALLAVAAWASAVVSLAEAS